MIIRQFLHWVGTARVPERAAAAAALARAYIVSPLEFDERCAAEAALTLLLDDPSPKVRRALAETLALSARAPQQVVSALACDQPEVAAPVLALSPLLSDADLIDRIAEGGKAAQRLVAGRARVSMELSAALAEIGDAEACGILLGNSGAAIAQISFRRMAERHGHEPALREALIADPRLPCETRHMLLVKLGEALRAAPLVAALMGEKRAERVMRDACTRASLTLMENTGREEYPALVEHLRVRGDLSTAFVMRTVAHGKVDFFGAVLAALTGQGERRIGALLSSGRDVALTALLRAAGLPEHAHCAIVAALKVWRDVARGRRVAGPQEVSWLMLKAVEQATPAEAAPAVQRELAGLLKAIHLEALRDNARAHALAIAAA